MYTIPLLMCLALPTSNAAEAMYGKVYVLWRTSLQEDLDKGRNLGGDDEVLVYLKEHASEHAAFLLEKLRKDRFMMPVLYGSSLQKEYDFLFAEDQYSPLLPEDVRQRRWMKTLSSHIYQEKFWQLCDLTKAKAAEESHKEGTGSTNSVTEETIDMKDRSNDGKELLAFLGKHAEENIRFLYNRVRHDGFVVGVLENSDLVRKHRAQFQNVSGINGKREVWIKILRDLRKEERRKEREDRDKEDDESGGN
jgi:hypothetical protein